MDTPNVVVVNHFKPHSTPVMSPQSDSIINCWKYIFENWNTIEWQPIPNWIRTQIKFHPQLGMCGGNLITRAGSKGMIAFINRMNNKEM